MRECKGCLRKFDDSVWLHPELKICSICYNIHQHSKVKFWDGKKWVKRNPKITDFIGTLEKLKNN